MNEPVAVQEQQTPGVVTQPQRELSAPEYQGSLIRASFNASCTDTGTAKQCGDLVVMLKAQTKTLEDTRKASTAGLTEAKRLTDAHFKDLKMPLEEAAARVQGHLDAYAEDQRQKQLAQLEQERKEREAEGVAEAERLQDAGDTIGADQALADAVDAPVSEPSTLKVRGDLGSSVTFDVDKDYEVENIQQVPWEFLKVEIKRAPLLAAIKAGRKDIPGIKITETAKGKAR